MTQTDSRPAAPIYDDLVSEHGDVLAEAREAAQETKREAEESLDFSELRERHGAADEPAFEWESGPSHADDSEDEPAGGPGGDAS